MLWLEKQYAQGKKSKTPREPLTERIKRTLIQRIVSGKYPPDTMLRELHLAQEFKASQSPVREALRHLEAMRLLDKKHFAHTRVRRVSEQEKRDSYRVRALLEQYAAELAAPHFRGNVKDLEALLAKAAQAAREGDVEAYAHSAIPMHRLIVAGAGNTVLLELWDSMAFEARTQLYLQGQAHKLPAAVREKRRILAALKEGNGQEAGRLLRTHIESMYFEPATPPADAAAGKAVAGGAKGKAGSRR